MSNLSFDGPFAVSSQLQSRSGGLRSILLHTNATKPPE
jgi:hypothetical protein